MPQDSTIAVSRASLSDVIARWKDDSDSTFNRWFLWAERLKNFRSIRRGIAQVVRDIDAGTFGNTYRGTSLETVVGAIAEQRQIFKGADHAFLWKPKLRIPDIYEDGNNQRAFGRLLDVCNCCDSAEAVVAAIQAIDAKQIKGLGPAVANLLYFIHPTFVVPFNTAIVRGYNDLTNGNVKLGRWDHYLSLREGVLRLNASHRDQLSNDLGAIASLLFDIGSARLPYLRFSRQGENDDAWRVDLAKVQAQAASQRRIKDAEGESDTTHTEVQGWLRELGKSLGFDVWIAANDRGRAFGDGKLADGCLAHLNIGGDVAPESARLIDVIWVDRDTGRASAAFEVEHSTSIYSGIVRMLDLALGSDLGAGSTLFLVAPDGRRDDVLRQLARPAFSRVAELGIRYLPYGELAKHRDAMGRFGTGLKGLLTISQRL